MFDVKYKISLSFFVFLVATLPLQADPWGIPSNPRETIFLHTDRDLYVAGEDLFFDLTLFSEPYSPHRASGFAYLALRNEHGIIKRASVKMDGFNANGNIYLPDTLSSGYYEIIAFTNWMRNAGEDWYFRKTLFIANRFDTELNKLFPPADAQPGVNFFPEGGQLVMGLENRVLMVVSGHFDASFREITITRQTGDTLAQTRLNEHGWGSFTLIPHSGEQYMAFLEGTDKPFSLPAANHAGVSMRVSQQNGDLLISLGVPSEGPFHGNLVLEQYGKQLRLFPISIAGGEILSHNIKGNDLPQGLFLVKLTGNDGTVISRRLWYRTNPQPDLGITVNDRFSKREEIILDIQNPGRLENTELNVTLARKEAFSNASLNLQGWQTSMELARKLQMKPAQACAIFGALSPEDINERLAGITANGSFDFSNAPDRNIFFMETSQLIVSGKVTQSLDGRPLENVRIILNTPDTLVNLRYTRTNSQGEFQFLLDGYYNDRDLVFTPDPETYQGLIDIEIFDKFVFDEPFEKTCFSGLAARKEYLAQAQEVLRVNKAFGITRLGASIIPQQYYFSAPQLYARPVTTLRLDDFAALDDLRDISRELILSWRIRQSGNQLRHSIVSANEREQLEGPPVLFIDGIITYDLQALMELNSTTLKEIQVHNLEWMHGEMYFPGIIALFSRDFLWKDLDLKPRPTIVFHEAPRTPGRFVSPSYPRQGDNAGEPDLRNLLFWEPALKLRSDRDTRVPFFASDLSGEYLLILQGLGPSGQAIHFEKLITITP